MAENPDTVERVPLSTSFPEPVKPCQGAPAPAVAPESAALPMLQIAINDTIGMEIMAARRSALVWKRAFYILLGLVFLFGASCMGPPPPPGPDGQPGPPGHHMHHGMFGGRKHGQDKSMPWGKPWGKHDDDSNDDEHFPHFPHHSWGPKPENEEATAQKKEEWKLMAGLKMKLRDLVLSEEDKAALENVHAEMQAKWKSVIEQVIEKNKAANPKEAPLGGDQAAP